MASITYFLLPSFQFLLLLLHPDVNLNASSMEFFDCYFLTAKFWENLWELFLSFLKIHNQSPLLFWALVALFIIGVDMLRSLIKNKGGL